MKSLVSAEFFKAAARCCQSAWPSFAASSRFTAVLHSNCSERYVEGRFLSSELTRSGQGMDREITRRDFLNGSSIALGGSLLATPRSTVHNDAGLTPAKLLHMRCSSR